MKFNLILALLGVLSASLAVVAEDAGANAAVPDVEDVVEDAPEELPLDNPSAPFTPTTLTAPFLEQFAGPTNKRWIKSNTKKEIDGVEDELLLRYRGEWNIEEASVVAGFAGDKGLVVKTPAAHHAISAVFPAPVDNKDKTLIVSYEVKLQNGLECGGAYMKLLTHNPSFTAEKFDDKTPYTIMFGPDRCGATNKVHFIFRHKNPVNGEWEEKHLISPPTAKLDKTSSVYTLIVRPDQTFEILINNENVKKGSLLEEFTPAVNPPKEIDDPTDSKPADWVDIARIPDPEAKKPEDWDEDAPAQIEDADAEKPDDWLENEPSTIADPSAIKPEDWDDEEDGDWVAPTIENPKCAEASGCGPWKRPLKANPAYKGKWKAPMIDNPDYKGPWAPKKIPNPNFFEDKTPSNFAPIGAIGFEIWTMQDKILFDNIFVGHDEEVAKAFIAETWAAKYKIETEKEKEVKKEEEKNADNKPYLERIKSFALDMRDRITAFVVAASSNPVEAIKADPYAAGTLGVVTLWFVYSISSIIAMYVGALLNKKKPVEAGKKGEKKEKKEAAAEKEVPAAAEKKEGGASVRKSTAKKADD
ncbi:hypothetical protein HDU97_000033 [Phlyctochytrium planicorne]|nr:hypothetical protein HDU97_000033 [Phlyctochytrium planicorne]